MSQVSYNLSARLIVILLDSQVFKFLEAIFIFLTKFRYFFLHSFKIIFFFFKFKVLQSYKNTLSIFWSISWNTFLPIASLSPHCNHISPSAYLFLSDKKFCIVFCSLFKLFVSNNLIILCLFTFSPHLEPNKNVYFTKY